MGTYGVQVHDLQIRPPLMGGEWGRAIGTVPRTPQAPDRPLLVLEYTQLSRSVTPYFLVCFSAHFILYR